MRMSKGAHGPGPGMGKAKDAKGTFKRLMGYIWIPHKLRLCLALLTVLISSVTTVAASLFLKKLIDFYITPMLSQSVPDFLPLIKALFIMGIIYLVGIIASYLQQRLIIPVSQGVLKQIRDEMFEHLQSLPIQYFDTHSHGDIMSHFTNDADTLRQMVSQSLPSAVSSIITILAVVISMLSTSIWLTVFVFLFLQVILKIVKFIGSKSSTYSVKAQNSLGALNGYIEEMTTGQKVIKVFCHEKANQEGFDKANEDYAVYSRKFNTYGNILMPIVGNMGHLQYVLIAIVGGSLAIAGVKNFTITGFSVITLGTIAAFLQLSRNFNMPISQVSQQINSVVMALAGAERIFELLDEKEETDNGLVSLVNVVEKNNTLVETSARTGIWAWKVPKEDGSYEFIRQQGDVRMQEVDFSYVEDKPVLHDITLYAKPGQKVAFVGPTGAGKTTITNLINRFYDIDDGKIRYDGININKIKKADLRKSLGVVLQDVNLFTGTVMDNIRYGRLDATDEECIQAAKLANAHQFISHLPEDYQTLLSGNGSQLSQGQRQLISIARAAVADPPVMILDEATSSIDTRTEAIVQRGMDQLMKGRTVFVIAHRLSTVQNADVIMVIQNGYIIERGTHDELIKQNGKYYELYTGSVELE